MRFVKIHEKDNVEVSLENGHKVALCNIKQGQDIIKYGFPIGVAVCDIKKGETVHSHNLKTALNNVSGFSYEPALCDLKSEDDITFSAFKRANGDIGIRNDIWIINTVGCVNKTAEIIAKKTGAFYFSHPYGCSQLGDDHKFTQNILRGLILHPNAGGVLVLGLGCENNNIDEMKKILGDYDKKRIRFLSCQDADDEIAEGCKIIEELKLIASGDKKEDVSVRSLKIGLKCGGSDGLSGITANPLVGRICNRFASVGASLVLTEIPEMFGAEKVLLNRCENKEVFEKLSALINKWKNYYISHGEPISENPSPGNKAGGITTLEEKSLGCVQKGGNATVKDVILSGEFIKKSGLSVLEGPGNDMVAVTNLTAAGCHLILFTTGRGTPLGAPVPTLKIATNSLIASKKSSWIDFDASKTLNENCDDEFFNLILKVAEGKQTKNEENSYREIAIFKSGVTL